MNTKWNIKGEYLESCTCKGACPCIYLGSPTEGSCTALVGWHIDQGRYGDVVLDNLNVAVALHSPGHMAEGQWKVVLYLDQAADPGQSEALGTIFGGKAGGHPAVLASFIAELLGVEQVPIRFEASPGRRRFEVGDTAEADVQAIEGQEGAAVTIRNHPLAVAPGETLTVATSRTLRHQAYGVELALSERTAFYSPFAYAGP
ncbi:DUF1326 domain-containing protein [Zobellella sp. DQSA1]|uniref:DUF1326 domain-containing protein n=1 Tax=Zobellella sp. DQSA1 TaxID=3342386 RepID=UPI0035C10434